MCVHQMRLDLGLQRPRRKGRSAHAVAITAGGADGRACVGAAAVFTAEFSPAPCHMVAAPCPPHARRRCVIAAALSAVDGAEAEALRKAKGKAPLADDKEPAAGGEEEEDDDEDADEEVCAGGAAAM